VQRTPAVLLRPKNNRFFTGLWVVFLVHFGVETAEELRRGRITFKTDSLAGPEKQRPSGEDNQQSRFREHLVRIKMRKIIALLVAVVILGICSTSQGLLLVYRVSSSVKGVDDTSGLALKVPFKAYLIMEFDGDGYYMDSNMVMFGSDQDGAKVYYQLNDNDSDNLLDTGIWNMGVEVPYMFVGLGTYGEDNPFNFEVCMWGKETAKDIGFGKENLWLVPSSMKGTFTVWYEMLYDDDQNISGTGNVSGKLDSVTYALNASGWTGEQAVALVISALQEDDYSQGVIKTSSKVKEKFEIRKQKNGVLVRAEK
jgi:hypothetical protein